MSLRPRARPKQLDLTLRTWGGRRNGAGRPPSGRRSLVSHETRPALASKYPVHVSLKLRRDIPNIRSRRLFRPIKRAFIAGCNREGFRVTHYSVQHNHIHLICEAKESRALSRGIQGLKIRIARGLNRQLMRRGKVFADRFHSRILKTPREVRTALAYVLHNRRSHAERAHHAVTLDVTDAFSSAARFDGWKYRPQVRQIPEGPPNVAEAKTWLLRVGWRRCGLLRP